MTAAEFDSLMDMVGPFEPRPQIAVAVSGGPDSLALALLADAWAGARQGSAVALTVDHGLRPESAAEAGQVGRWVSARGMTHHVLRWREAKPASGIQAAAREARYRLLGEWCRRHGVVHLLTAHHMEDQAETFVLRLERGSGMAGLACMAAISETPWLRLLRPLLTVPRGRLRACLEAWDQPWIEDPSNTDSAFARARIRGAMPALADAGLEPLGIAGATRRLGRSRAVLERRTARLLARCAAIFPAGYCRLDGAMLASAPEDIGLQALSNVVTCIGGQPYPPRVERLTRLYRSIAEGRLSRTRTLGGCLISPRRGEILVTRESARGDHPEASLGSGETRWDRRFRVIPHRDAAAAAGPQRVVSALGRDGWREIAEHRPDLRSTLIPGPARPRLPAIREENRVIAVPHLGYGPASGRPVSLTRDEVLFWPAHSLAGAPFSVV